MYVCMYVCMYVYMYVCIMVIALGWMESSTVSTYRFLFCGNTLINFYSMFSLFSLSCCLDGEIGGSGQRNVYLNSDCSQNTTLLDIVMERLVGNVAQRDVTSNSSYSTANMPQMENRETNTSTGQEDAG